MLFLLIKLIKNQTVLLFSFIQFFLFLNSHYALIIFLSFSNRDGKEIKQTDMKSSFDGTTARLTISSAKSEFSGSYKIVISNEFGKDESSAELLIKVRIS